MTRPAAARTITLRVSPEAERQIRFGHPWLYASGITKLDGEERAGAFAVLYDRRNRFLALGLYDPASPIRVRILQRHRPAPIDVWWFGQRMAEAVSRREPLARPAITTGYRLVHGENDGLPGLVLDRYDETLVLKLYTGAWVAHVPALLEAIEGAVESRRVVLRLSRAVQASGKALAGLADGTILTGAPPRGPVRFLENGLQFEADVLRGQKTGFFLDQRDNRARVESLCRRRRVLDGFAYTGACSVYAARGGADEVTSVDASRSVLATAHRHLALNQAHPGVARVRHHVIVADVFEALETLRSRRERYGVVILDPPSFANSREAIPMALKAYHRLVRLGLSVLEPEGVFVLSSCSGQVSAEAFFATVHRAARSMKRVLKELARTAHPLDHPIGFREGAYLKGLFAIAKSSQPNRQCRDRHEQGERA